MDADSRFHLRQPFLLPFESQHSEARLLLERRSAREGLGAFDAERGAEESITASPTYLSSVPLLRMRMSSHCERYSPMSAKRRSVPMDSDIVVNHAMSGKKHRHVALFSAEMEGFGIRRDFSTTSGSRTGKRLFQIPWFLSTTKYRYEYAHGERNGNSRGYEREIFDNDAVRRDGVPSRRARAREMKTRTPKKRERKRTGKPPTRRGDKQNALRLRPCRARGGIFT